MVVLLGFRSLPAADTLKDKVTDIYKNTICNFSKKRYFLFQKENYNKNMYW